MALRIFLLAGVALALGCAASFGSRQIAEMRGSAQPDSIDVLIARALSAKGEYREVGDMAYGFLGDNGPIEALSRIPAAIPRLVECMGWDLKSHSTFEGQPLFAGVVCFQGIVHSDYFQKRNLRGWPGGFEDAAFINYDAPSLEELRKAQRRWREQLLRDPP